VVLRRNILLFHQGALGDFIVTWPLALGLGRVFAQSRIFYVTGSQKGALAERALRVESTDVEAGWHQLYSSDPHLPDPAARLLAGAQQIIGFNAGPDDQWTRNIRSLAPQASVLTLSSVPPADFQGHVTEYMLAQLKQSPLIEAALDQMLRSIAARGLGFPVSKDGTIVLHPGAGSGKKCWPAERFLELATLLTNAGRSVQIILGEVEREKWPAAQLESFRQAFEIVTPATLVELMHATSCASVFIGNDSGPGHLAGILGIPTISIFGPTHPARWRPLGPRTRVVSGEWDSITADDIMKVVSEM
jgi:heptosyltransferase-3